MRPAHVIEIVTPKKFVLNGLWFGPKKVEHAIILIHGLSSSAFSRLPLVDKLVDAEIAVMTFNNRGHDNVSRVARVKGEKRVYKNAGAAHEKFVDCVDDLRGVVRFAKKRGVRKVYLAGHSTGCQKAVYYLARANNPNVNGVILLAPLSDYAGALQKYGAKKLAKLVHYAKAMIKKKRGDELLPRSLWKEEPDDAYRFISLYTPESAEQKIFSYFDPKKIPTTYRSIKIPMLALFADDDEYADRSAEQLLQWFAANTYSHYFRGGIIPKVEHSFRGGESRVARLVKQWIRAV